VVLNQGKAKGKGKGKGKGKYFPNKLWRFR